MGKELLRKSSTEEQVMHSSRVHTHFSKHHFYLFSPSLVHYEYERARDGAAALCQALLLKAAPQGLLSTQASSAAASDTWQLGGVQATQKHLCELRKIRKIFQF